MKLNETKSLFYTNAPTVRMETFVTIRRPSMKYFPPEMRANQVTITYSYLILSAELPGFKSLSAMILSASLDIPMMLINSLCCRV